MNRFCSIIIVVFTLSIFLTLDRSNIIMQIECSAPRCTEMVEISRWTHFKAKVMSKLRGGDFVNFVFCPPHKERMTFGKFDDNDPTTNPDLNESRKDA